MKVFLAGVIQGTLQEPAIRCQSWREPLREALRRQLPEADLYCQLSRHPDGITYELPEIVRTLAEGNRLAGECDLLVAWLPEASMGTAIEMYEASRHGAVVLTVSSLCASWVVRAYSDRIFPDLATLEDFLASAKLRELLESKSRGKPSER